MINTVPPHGFHKIHMAGRGKANKRACPDPVDQQRFVLVQDDKARTEVAGFIDFLNQVTSERDALKATCNTLRAEKEAAEEKVSDLQGTVAELRQEISNLEVDSDVVVNLKKDLEYFTQSREEEKAAKEKFEMGNRRLEEENTRLKTSLNKYKHELNTAQDHLNTKDGELSNLRNLISKIKLDISNLRNRVASQQKENGALETELQRLRSENNDNGERINDLLAANRDVEEHRNEIEKLKTRIVDLEKKNTENQTMFEEIKSLFYDTVKADNDGTGILIGTGKMYSFKNVARRWKNAANFDGSPSSPLVCDATRATTTIIHNPAILDFTKRVATAASLKPYMPFYFKYSEHAADVQPVVWKEYSLYDQLTLIAKVLSMYKAPVDITSCFQVVLAGGHFVTSVTSRNPTTKITTARISLSVICNTTGASKTHRIEFVDQIDSDSPNLGLFFPATFVVANMV